MELKLDPETMRQVVQKVVIDEMTPAAKEEILVKAVASLFKPNEYGRKTSPLEELFSEAAMHVARDVVRAELAKPEIQAQLSAMVCEAWNKMLSDTGRRDKVVERMADALTDAMVAKEYR